MKHQELVLVILGYVIGFTTAFIWFGVDLNVETDTAALRTADEDGYGLVAKASSNTQQAAIIDAFVNGEGLFARIGDTERIVSANADAAEEGSAGYHYAIPAMSVAPNQQYLHFCAVTGPLDPDCDHYIYSVTVDTIFPVKDVTADAYVATDISSLESMWTSDSRLVVNEQTSTSAAQPWMIE